MAWTYAAVSLTLWDDRKFRALSDEAQRLLLYVLTAPARTGEGYYRLSAATAIDHLRWSRRQFDTAMDELRAFDLVDYDDEARIVFIVRALKHHEPIRGAKSLAAAVKVLDGAKDSPRLFGRFLAAADRYQPAFAAAIRAHYGLAEGPYEPTAEGAPAVGRTTPLHCTPLHTEK